MYLVNYWVYKSNQAKIPKFGRKFVFEKQFLNAESRKLSLIRSSCYGDAIYI